MLSAAWWRFDHYVLGEDGRIRPDPEARGERYDPWKAFQEARRGRPKRRYGPADEAAVSPRRRVELPYQELMTIAKEYSDRPQRRGVGRPRQTTEALVGWCEANGLLGLLHHQLLAVRVPPSPDEPEDFGGMSIVRTARGWSSESIPGRKTRHGRPLGLMSTLSPGVVLQWFPTDELRWDGFAGEWSHYFASDSPLRTPQASTRGPHMALADGDEPAEISQRGEWPPLPNEEAFWREYGEPVSEFVAAGMRLTEAVEAMRLGREQESLDHLARIGAGDLTVLAGSVSPRLATDTDNQWHLRWSAPSLLGSLSLMVMGDVSGGARIISCRSCGVPAVTRSERGAYCTARCRERGPART